MIAYDGLLARLTVRRQKLHLEMFYGLGLRDYSQPLGLHYRRVTPDELCVLARGGREDEDLPANNGELIYFHFGQIAGVHS